MSLFGSGADCGPVNPLQSLLKHSERDASSQFDRFTQLPGPSTTSNGLRTQQQRGPQNGDAEMQRFFAGNPVNHTGIPASSGMDGFAMQALHQEVASMQHQNRARGSREGSATPGSADWAKQFGADQQPMRHSPNQHQQEAWRASFASPAPSVNSQVHASASAGPSGLQSQYYPQQSYQPMFQTYGGGMNGSYMPMDSMQYMRTGQNTAPMLDKGKSRFVELDDTAWEAQFAKLDQPAGRGKAKDATAQVPEPFQEGAEQVQDDPAGIAELEEETDDAFAKNLEHTWRNLKDTMDTSALSDAEHAAWEAQYGTNFADLHDGFEDDADFAAQAGLDPKTFDDWLKQATDREFPFEQAADNPFVDTFDPFAEGQRLLRDGHPLSEAALAFEAACKQNPHRGEAWRALGDTLAADEKEVKAIRALERAVSCSDQGGEGAWMSLAISYVNEGQDLRAYATLEKWITMTYPDIAAQINGRVQPETSNNPWSISTKIVDMFLAAARSGPAARTGGAAGQTVDADVQSGLGVLFYTNSEYARARDCFEAALSARPDDFLLWNRLGATLANGGQPEEAIDAYRKALELRPTFTRAIYNLGVSCLNINCYHEAAEHLLAALDLHRRDQLVGGKGKGPALDEMLDAPDGSDNLWHTLRRAFLCLERPDLADRARPGGDVASFRRDGFDF